MRTPPAERITARRIFDAANGCKNRAGAESMAAHILSRIAGGAILATGGWALAEFIADVWWPEQYLFLVIGLALAGAAAGIAWTPFVTRRVYRSIAEQTRGLPASRLLSSIVGMVLGLTVAMLVSIPIYRVPGWLGLALPIAISLFLAYVGAMLMFSPSRDVFHRLSTGSRSSSSDANEGADAPMLLDTSAIIDGRIAAISKTGFLRGTLLVPRFVLDELRHVADSRDTLRRSRGRRGLEMLREMREESNVRTQVIEADYPQSQEVDGKLVGLAKQLRASIVTTDFNLNRVASIDGIQVLNVNDLANAMRPVVVAGERFKVKILQEGREHGQGVGFLEDGTMVVVESGIHHLDTELDVTAARVLQTASGCMVFANPS